MNDLENIGGLLADARQIIDTARANAVRSVDFNRVQMYWNLGRRIFEEEQHGKDRAEYGSHLIRNLAAQLEPEYGSGFGVRQLDQSRKFYRLYPIAHTLCAQLNWSQYKLLISIEEPEKREYYQLEAVSNCWTKRRARRARPTARGCPHEVLQLPLQGFICLVKTRMTHDMSICTQNSASLLLCV